MVEMAAELRRVRDENMQLREAAARPPAAREVREAVDASDIDDIVARALAEALARDSAAAQAARDQAQPTSSFQRARDRSRSATPRRSPPASAASLPTAPSPAPMASSGVVDLPESVSPALHKAFLGWLGTKGSIPTSRPRTKWAEDTGKRFALPWWTELLKERGMTQVPTRRGPLVEAALARFVELHPEHAGGPRSR